MTPQKAYKIFLNTLKENDPEIYAQMKAPFDALPEQAKIHYQTFSEASNAEVYMMLEACINVVKTSIRAESIFSGCRMLQTRGKKDHNYTIGVLEHIIGALEEFRGIL